MVIPYQRIGRTYWYCLQGSRNPKERTGEELRLTEKKNLLSVGLAHHPIFLRSMAFWKTAVSVFRQRSTLE
jgi:hypothetical protein